MSTQIAFFANVQQMGAVVYNKPKAAKLADPLAQAKAKFAVAVDKQAALIKAAADKGLWFKKEGEKYHITLKNGVAALNKEQPAFTLANASQAVAFLDAAKQAAAKGEFDALFTATNKAPRAAKEAAAPAATGENAAQAPAAAPSPARKRVQK